MELAMSNLISKYMVECKADPNTYLSMTRAQMARLKSPVYLEGVDGDEDNNTVTYWYIRTPLDAQHN
jgi:hypothetical protein